MLPSGLDEALGMQEMVCGGDTGGKGDARLCAGSERCWAASQHCWAWGASRSPAPVSSGSELSRGKVLGSGGWETVSISWVPLS